VPRATKGYLSGTDVAERFATLDRRVRGETRSPKWIHDLRADCRPNLWTSSDVRSLGLDE
jgi:phenolic acid decarboxylase